MQLLINYGGNVNNIGCCGCTPLHIAVKNRNIQIVQLLLTFGASVNQVNYARQSP